MVVFLVLVESALQIVPDSIRKHPQIRAYARRRQKRVDEILLDRSFHHSAMKTLTRTNHPIPIEKMGRPDIVHTTLLQVLETPLNWEGHLRVFIHTQDQDLITINPNARLPKNYIRFVGLMEQLFAEGRVPPKGETLLSIKKMRLDEFIQESSSSRIIAFTTLGKPALMRSAAKHASEFRSPAIFIGAFPRGHFSKETEALIQESFSIDKQSLDSWIVAGRFIYEFEQSIGLPEQRIKSLN